MRDFDVRQALHKYKLQHFHTDDDSRVLDELEVCHGEARVDIAIVNGHMHGYEIKSDKDTLTRLPHQIEAYSKVFDYMTLVVGKNHADAALALVPEWWGVQRATFTRGRIYFKKIRIPTENTQVDPLAICQLLWRNETISLLQKYGLLSGIKSKPRKVLWEKLASNVPVSTLGYEVRTLLKNRKNWRAAPRPRKSGGSFPRIPKLFDYQDHMSDLHSHK